MEQKMVRRGREFWNGLVVELDALEGVTQTDFAKTKGVKIESLRSWIYRLRDEQQDPTLCRTSPGGRPKGKAVVKATKARFLEVDLPTQPLVLVRAGHVSVEFAAVPPPSWVAELAARLGGP